jgi:hypothetical protein
VAWARGYQRGRHHHRGRRDQAPAGPVGRSPPTGAPVGSLLAPLALLPGEVTAGPSRITRWLYPAGHAAHLTRYPTGGVLPWARAPGGVPVLLVGMRMIGWRDDLAILSGRCALVRAAVRCLVMFIFRLAGDSPVAADGTLGSRWGRLIFCPRWRDRRAGVLVAMVDRLILTFDHHDPALRALSPFGDRCFLVRGTLARRGHPGWLPAGSPRRLGFVSPADAQRSKQSAHQTGPRRWWSQGLVMALPSDASRLPSATSSGGTVAWR